jgi:probable rRNA maturation factor
MTIEIEKESELLENINFNELFTKVVNAACDYVDCPYEIAVNILLVEDEEIHSINMEQRNIDRPTDVLSFPMLEYSVAGRFDDIDEDDLTLFDPESGELILGDIVISLETALRQAELYNHSVIREIAFLCAHSMLHLFGYDHMDDEERKVMEKMQEEILEGINITRDYE